MADSDYESLSKQELEQLNFVPLWSRTSLYRLHRTTKNPFNTKEFLIMAFYHLCIFYT